jgi:hypothetical protein
MYSSRDNRPLRRLGCPIRRPPDQRLLSGFPELFAASHVLHRLLAPRHPPCALSSLTTTIRATTLEHSFGLLPRSDHMQFSKNHPRHERRAAHRATLRRVVSSSSKLFHQSALPSGRTSDLKETHSAPPCCGMELKGVEPSTSGLQNRRSPN